MNITEEVGLLLHEAMERARIRRYEYVTPELLLLVICDNLKFSKAFTVCAGETEELKNNLERYLAQNVEVIQNEKLLTLEFSNSAGKLMAMAQQAALSSGKSEIELSHLISAFWKLDNCFALYYMQVQGIERADLLGALKDYEDFDEFDLDDEDDEDDELPFGETQSMTDMVKACAPCLNDTLKDVNPLIGRENELERTIQILCRKDKNNPLHIGEPGVGKTAITYGLVQKIKSGEVPDAIKGARVYALDLGSILAGTQYRGEFEKRFKKILETVSAEKKPIIYIDEIHNLLGAGATGEGSFDAANILKPYMAAGHIRFIGATTFEEYKKHFEKSKSLVRRFQNVEIAEPSAEETIKILEGLKKGYEKYHKVTYSKGVLEYAVHMSVKYINERFLPDKAIDLIDEAGAYRRIHPLEQKRQTVGKEIIDEILTNICRVPVKSVETDELSGLATLEERILSRVFGQDMAVRQVVNAIKFSRAGLLEDNKPLASLLFVGPTGVGKTEIAKVLAEELGIKLVRFDMSEYGEKHAVAKLIGAPAGYVGYEEGGLLTEAIRKNPSAVLLLDEIEKAHSDIYSTLLQVMDYATLTDNQGRKADFRNVIIIMTSNAGASKLGKMTLGFSNRDTTGDVLLEEVKNVFQPEFRNRLSKIVAFNRMDDEMAKLIVGKKLKDLGKRLAVKKVELEVSDEVVEFIKTKGITPEYGAREIDRVIQSDIKPLLVDELLFGKLKKGGKCALKLAEGQIVCKFTAGK